MKKPPRCIPLTKGFVAIISHEDFRRVNRHKWHVHMSAGSKRKPGQPYARASSAQGEETGEAGRHREEEGRR